MRILLTTSAMALLGLAACSTTPPTTMVNPEPTYNKMGEGECEEDYIYIPGTPWMGECIPEPDDERPPDDDDDDPRDPTFTGTTVPPTSSTPPRP